MSSDSRLKLLAKDRLLYSLNEVIKCHSLQLYNEEMKKSCAILYIASETLSNFINPSLNEFIQGAINLDDVSKCNVDLLKKVYKYVYKVNGDEDVKCT